MSAPGKRRPRPSDEDDSMQVDSVRFLLLARQLAIPAFRVSTLPDRFIFHTWVSFCFESAYSNHSTVGSDFVIRTFRALDMDSSHQVDESSPRACHLICFISCFLRFLFLSSFLFPLSCFSSSSIPETADNLYFQDPFGDDLEEDEEGKNGM